MNIGKKYKIESDALNITLYEKGKTKAGKVRWKAIGYFATVQSVLKFLVDLGVRESQLTDLKAIVAKQDELYALISDLPPSSIRKQSVTGATKVKSGSPIPKEKKEGENEDTRS